MIEMFTCSPEHLTVPELIQELRKGTAQSSQHQATKDACAFELFRCAIVLRDEQAWFGIYTLYNAVVSSWILRLIPKIERADLDALVNDVFAKFAHAMNALKWRNFSCVQQLLGYLRLCARSVVVDHCRRLQLQQREKMCNPLDQAPVLDDDPADVVVAQFANQEFWRIIDREVTCSEEQLILRAICALGLSPHQLQQRYPLLFPTVDDIYRLRRNVLERLRRNKELQQLLDHQSHYQARKVSHAS
jgi:DNA-directed RNA polymerase specialized sigma24 family protein